MRTPEDSFLWGLVHSWGNHVLLGFPLSLFLIQLMEQDVHVTGPLPAQETAAL